MLAAPPKRSRPGATRGDVSAGGRKRAKRPPSNTYNTPHPHTTPHTRTFPFLIMRPANSTPLNGVPSAAIAFAVASTISSMTCDSISGVTTGAGEYAPMPPVLGPAREGGGRSGQCSREGRAPVAAGPGAAARHGLQGHIRCARKGLRRPPRALTRVAVADRLVVLRRRQRHRGLAVHERKERRLLAVKELLHHHHVACRGTHVRACVRARARECVQGCVSVHESVRVRSVCCPARPCGPWPPVPRARRTRAAERAVEQHRVDRGARLVHRRRHDHALAGRQARGLHHNGRALLPDVRLGGVCWGRVLGAGGAGGWMRGPDVSGSQHALHRQGGSLLCVAVACGARRSHAPALCLCMCACACVSVRSVPGRFGIRPAAHPRL